MAVEAMDSDDALKEIFEKVKIRGSRNNLYSLYLRIYPFGQQFQTKPIVSIV